MKKVELYDFEERNLHFNKELSKLYLTNSTNLTIPGHVRKYSCFNSTVTGMMMIDKVSLFINN